MQRIKKRLSLTTLFSYGATAIPLAMLGLPLYIYLPTFYVESVGLNVILVGVILFVARLSDVITDPLVGIYSDKFESRYGRRKPFLIVGSLILVASFYALIHPPSTLQAFWLFGFSMLVYLGWSIVSIPYLAWSAEISTDYHEKTRLSASRELLTIVGAITALLIPYLYGVSDDASESLELLYVRFAMTLLIFIPITLIGLREYPTSTHFNFSLIKIKALWQSVPYLGTLQWAFLLNALANALPSTLFLFFVELVLQAKEQTGMLLLLYFVAGVIGLPFWTLLARRIGKRKSWMASMILASSAFAFVPFLGAGDVLLFGIISFVSGLSLGADMALPSSIQADLVQSLQTKTDTYSGVLFGVWAMLTKMALALAVGIGFVILGLVDFDSSNPTPLSLTTLTLLYGGLPVVFKVVAFITMLRYQEERISPNPTN